MRVHTSLLLPRTDTCCWSGLWVVGDVSTIWAWFSVLFHGAWGISFLIVLGRLNLKALLNYFFSFTELKILFRFHNVPINALCSVPRFSSPYYMAFSCHVLLDYFGLRLFPCLSWLVNSPGQDSQSKFAYFFFSLSWLDGNWDCRLGIPLRLKTFMYYAIKKIVNDIHRKSLAMLKWSCLGQITIVIECCYSIHDALIWMYESYQNS